MTTTKPIAIIGAGIAGLTAANFLLQHKIPFILFEGGKKIAGLATSFKDAEGFSYDFGAHFITNRLAEAVGVSSDCLLVKHYGEAVWLKGKSYNYPFGLVKIPRMTWSWFAGQVKLLRNRHKPNSAPIAYPIFLNEYEKERQNFEQSTGIQNLLSIGRNGEFSHMFMEDVYWRTQKKVKTLIQKMRKSSACSSHPSPAEKY